MVSKAVIIVWLYSCRKSEYHLKLDSTVLGMVDCFVEVVSDGALGD